MTQIVPIRRQPGVMPSWPPESLDKRSTISASVREIDRLLTFPPDAAKALDLSDKCVKAATLLLNLHAEAVAKAKALTAMETQR